MFKKLVFLFIIASTQYSIGQTIREVKESGRFLYGIGQHGSYEKADQLALGDLLSQISVDISDSLVFTREEENGNYLDYAKSIISTYASGTLTNARRIEEESEGAYTVMRYLAKSQVEKLFKAREEAIVDYLNTGLKAIDQLQIGDALRNLYWANALLVSHPDYLNLKGFVDKDSVLLRILISNKISEVFNNISVNITENRTYKEDQYQKVVLKMLYEGAEIQSLDYSYRTQTSWSSPISLNNGIALLEFYGEQIENTNFVIRIEYRYPNKVSFDKDVQNVFNSNIDLPYYRECEININSTSTNLLASSTLNNGLRITWHEIESDERSALTVRMDQLFRLIKNKSEVFDQSYFSEEGITNFTQLITYGRGDILTENLQYEIYRVNNEYYVRSIPVRFKFLDSKEFIEDVVFVFNQDFMLSDVNFSLGHKALDDILGRDAMFTSKEEKWLIIRFLETYKTAYCLKRIDYLNQLFDDNALIIVGNVLKVDSNTDTKYMNALSQDQTKYQKLSKTEYIENLKRVFSRNEYVNIHFEDNIVKKAKRDVSIYGIQIAQHYSSSLYSDRGFLFLLVDLRNTEIPVIHVRTWQPQKNLDGKIFGLEDFPFDIF